MLVNLLLQDGKSNYMEGLMCEFAAIDGEQGHMLTASDVALSRHRTLLCSLISHSHKDTQWRTREP